MVQKTMVQRRSRSLTYDDEDTERGLCLCEYYNRNNERAHLLNCLCNCEAIDLLCTSVCCCCTDREEIDLNESGRRKNNSICFLLNCLKSRQELLFESLADINDRIRVPMIGGARRIELDFVISASCLLVYLMFGTMNLVASVLAIFLLPCVVFARFFLSRLSLNKAQAASSTVMLTSRSKMTANQARIDKPNIRIAFFMVIQLFFQNTQRTHKLFSNNIQNRQTN